MRDGVRSRSPDISTDSEGVGQRSRGRGSIEVRPGPAGPSPVGIGPVGTSRLADLRQEGCARLRLPRAPHGSTAPLEAIAINTGGGLTGGDRLNWSARAREHSRLSLTSQACERIYRAEKGRAEIGITLEVGTGARLLWWPQETIVFDGGAFHRRLDAVVDPTATLLVVEATLFGRAAMGERFTRGLIRDSWRIRRSDGRLVHAEEVRIEGEADLAGPAALGGAGAMATLLLVAPDAERYLDAARALMGGSSAASCWATSCWEGRLLARIVAEDGYALRRTLVPLAAELAGRDVPRGWNF